MSRKYYITTVTGNLRDETVVNLLRITASLRDLLEFVNKPQGFFLTKWLSFRGLEIRFLASEAKTAILLSRKTAIELFWEMSNTICELSRRRD